MYRCTDCGRIFEECLVKEERHGLCCPPFERIAACPYCLGTAIQPIEVRHCRCCGVRLSGKKTDYCSESCRSRGMKLWRLEADRRRRRISSPISVIMRELADYNSEHSTDYSYGQYVSLVRPKLRGGGAIC